MITYTTQEEIVDIFSTEGSDLHVDDILDPPEFWVKLCERATSRVNQYLLGLFSAENLSSHVRVREITTYIACYILSIRRGNPALYRGEYEDALNDLEQIKTGNLYLDLPRRQSHRVVMQNPIIDNRFVRNPNRVEPLSATNLIGGQAILHTVPFGWL